MNKLPFDLILFDLGGVLVDNEGPVRIANWLPTETSVEVIFDQWLTSPIVRAFESGQMPSEDFAIAIIDELNIPLSPSEFLDDFSLWVTRLYSGAENLLKQLRSNYKLGCLSNTNVIHWQYMQTDLKLSTLLDYTFASCETGLLKPDKEVFLHLIQETGFAPERILFFDDSQRNIDSATAEGIVAYKTVGLLEVHNTLEKIETALV